MVKFSTVEADQTHELFNNIFQPTVTHEVLLSALSSGGGFQAFAAWEWVASGDNVKAWHSIYHGLDPMAGVNTDPARFPININQYGLLSVDMSNVTVRGDGRWCLAFDLFLYRQAPYVQENVQAEIFIVLKRQNYAVPTATDSFTANGVTWNHGQWGPGTLHVFWSTAELPTTFTFSGFNFYPFINHLLSHAAISGNEILTGVYFGAEPIDGSGYWRTESYHVNLMSARPCFAYMKNLQDVELPNGYLLVDGVRVNYYQTISLIPGTTHTFTAGTLAGHSFRYFLRWYWPSWIYIDKVTSSSFTWPLPTPPGSDGWAVVAYYT